MAEGVVVLCSGGLDSCALLAHELARGRTVFPLFVRAGLAWEAAELAALRRFVKRMPGRRGIRPIKVAGLPMADLYGRHWSVTGRGVPRWDDGDETVYIPGRNIVLLAKGAVYAASVGAGRVAIGPLKGNPFPDASPRFFSSFSRAVSAGLGTPIRVEAPFLKLTKRQVIRRFDHLPLELTLSCSKPRGRSGGPCGRCAKCRERILAFKGDPKR